MYKRQVLGRLPEYAGPPEGLAETPQLAGEYPLVLSDVHAYRLCMHSYYTELPSLRARQPEPWLKINPATAARLGIDVYKRQPEPPGRSVPYERGPAAGEPPGLGRQVGLV